ncbi:hypothetical protein [Cysteiniphilum sp. JM-1]|uniref:hypothetical protein n=1 Tax=Cysteiniphilum sp. JM-1 TaxID=2610891 RepID=UPI0012466E11|nr:hypothetical protein [Cysteiniphilum sp. JM-1]
MSDQCMKDVLEKLNKQEYDYVQEAAVFIDGAEPSPVMAYVDNASEPDAFVFIKGRDSWHIEAANLDKNIAKEEINQPKKNDKHFIKQIGNASAYTFENFIKELVNREVEPLSQQTDDHVIDKDTDIESIESIESEVINASDLTEGVSRVDTPKYGRFERGVAIIMGLSYGQAKAIYDYIEKLRGEKKVYGRKSTHGDLTWGYYLDPKDYISSQHETFRHVVFSYPKPYMSYHDLNSGQPERKLDYLDTLFSDTDETVDLFQSSVSNQDSKDKKKVKYYFRVKPESFGMNTYKDMTGHTLSYLYTRYYNDYKKQAGYYGDGSNIKYNNNGCLVIDLENKQITPYTTSAHYINQLQDDNINMN